MLSIGEFSNICKVSTKTLRYYAEIGLLKPSEVNPENGYRYRKCYEKLFKRIAVDGLTMCGAPMVLFHSAEYSVTGMDTEFAIPVKEFVAGTRNFCPGLCLKTVVHGAYTKLSSVYTKQVEWAKQKGYRCTDALFEVYITDPSQVADVQDNITEVYYPVKKITSNQ